MADDRSMRKGGEAEPDVDNIPPLTNSYITPKHKKISGGLKKVDRYNAKAYQATQNVINDARETYTVEYVKHIISIAKNNHNLMGRLELSEEEERDTLKMIFSLKNIRCGIGQEDLERLLHTIEYVSELEECLFRKGLLKKEPFSLRLTNKISKEGGEMG